MVNDIKIEKEDECSDMSEGSGSSISVSAGNNLNAKKDKLRKEIEKKGYEKILNAENEGGERNVGGKREDDGEEIIYNDEEIYGDLTSLSSPNFTYLPYTTTSQSTVQVTAPSKIHKIPKENEEIQTLHQLLKYEKLLSKEEDFDVEEEIFPDKEGGFGVNFEEIFGGREKADEIFRRKRSVFGGFPTFKLFKCIVKTNEDLRQEQFATQLINEFYQIFQMERTGLWLNTYEIICINERSGLVECIDNALSLDQLKHKTNGMSLKDFFIFYFGKGTSKSKQYKKAMNNYVKSLAAYSLVCYFLQIKDRHNGNIMLDNEGHIIHIDFGFLLSNSPGKGFKFEKAPFKLSDDLLQCMGGTKSKYFREFRRLLKDGLLAINKHHKKIVILVEMMWCGHGKNLDCFEGGQETIEGLKRRLCPKENLSKGEAYEYVDELIGDSVGNWRTDWYDKFQYFVQDIFY